MRRFVILYVLAFALLGAVEPLAGQEVVFEDRFEGALQPGWAWLRDSMPGFRFVNNSLEILSEPLFSGKARNALVRPFNFIRWQNTNPNASCCIETECFFLEKPTEQYQQCGLYWMQKDKVVFKLVFACVDGQICVYPGKTPVKSLGGRLRMTVTGQNIVAEFCGLDETDFQRVYEGKIPGCPDRISLQCSGGKNSPDDPESTQWARFRYFRISKVD